MNAGNRPTNDSRSINRVEVKLLLAVTIIGAALRMWSLISQPLWLDEAFSIWVANQSPGELLQFVSNVDQHPPLYYMLLHSWQALLGDGEGAVRMLSVILGVATIPLFYLGGRLLVGRKPALIASLVLALSPFHIRYAQEARMYALMAFLGAAILCSLSVYLAASQPRTARRHAAFAGLIISESALLYTHNSAVLLLPAALNVGVLVPWLWCHGRRRCSLPTLGEDGFLGRWLLLQAIVFLFWLPWLPTFVNQAGTVYQEFWIQPLSRNSIWLVFHNINLPFPEEWSPGLAGWDLFYWGLAILGLYSLRKRGATAFLLGALFIVPIVLEILISLQRPVLGDRTLIWNTLPYYLLIGCGMVRALDPAMSAWTRRDDAGGPVRTPTWSAILSLAMIVALLGVLIALPLISLKSYYRDFEKEDWALVGEHVAAHASDDDLVLFNATWSQIPVEYYTRNTPVSADMAGIPGTLFDSGKLEPIMTKDDVAYLHELTSSYDELWLVYAHEWYTDPAGIIPQALTAGYDLVDEQGFRGPRVLHYSKRAAFD